MIIGFTIAPHSAVGVLGAGAGSYILAGAAASLRNSATAKLLTAAAGAYIVTGTAATITKSGGSALARSGMLPGVAVNTSTTSRTANAAGVMVNG